MKKADQTGETGKCRKPLVIVLTGTAATLMHELHPPIGQSSKIFATKALQLGAVKTGSCRQRDGDL